LEAFPKKAFAGVCLFTVFAALAFYVTPIHLGRVLSEIGVSEPARIGMAAGVGSLGVPLGAVLFRRFAGAPLHRLLTVAMLLIGIPLIGLFWSDAFGQVFALFFVNQIGCGLLLPVVISWCLSHLPFEWRGRGSGLWNSTFFISQFLTPIAFTLAVRESGSVHSAMLVFGSGALIVAIVIAATRVQWGRMGEDTLPEFETTSKGKIS
jgi:sugar phosphate permease